MNASMPDKPNGQSDTIAGGSLAGLITIAIAVLKGLDVNVESKLAVAIFSVLYSIAGLLVVVGARGIGGEIATELKKLNDTNAAPK